MVKGLFARQRKPGFILRAQGALQACHRGVTFYFRDDKYRQLDATANNMQPSDIMKGC